MSDQRQDDEDDRTPIGEPFIPTDDGFSDSEMEANLLHISDKIGRVEKAVLGMGSTLIKLREDVDKLIRASQVKNN
jgi:hypothetical protein